MRLVRANTAVSQDFTVTAEDLVATTLDRISGNSQTAVVSTALSNPFVVEVQDQNGDAISGITVTFAVRRVAAAPYLPLPLPQAQPAERNPRSPSAPQQGRTL